MPAPALLKGYLRCGSYVCGEPAWDPEFDTADFFVLLPMQRMTARYARHFLGADQTSAGANAQARRIAA